MKLFFYFEEKQTVLLPFFLVCSGGRKNDKARILLRGKQEAVRLIMKWS